MRLDSILTADAIHAMQMERGSVMLRKSIDHARAGNIEPLPIKTTGNGNLLWWDHGRSASNWQAAPAPSKYRQLQDREYAEQIARREFAETLRTNRDPCPLCAVRGDIGCKHSRRFS